MAVARRAGEPAGYKVHSPDPELTRVYGGGTDRLETFDSRTLIDIAKLEACQQIEIDGEFLAYLTGGSGVFGSHDQQAVKDADLLRG